MKTIPLVTAAAISIMAAGCASSTSSSQPSAPATTVTVTSSPSAASPGPSGPSPSATSSAPSGPSPCATSSLRVSLGPSNGYAGGVTEPIDFTNTSTASCRLYGFPGVSLVTGPSHQQIGLSAKRSRNATPVLVTLPPGATAHAVLQIVDALNYPPATCQPTKATALRVYPPNQTAPLYIPTTPTTCAKPIQTLTITPVQPGPS